MFSKPKTYIANSLYSIKYSSYSSHIFYIVVNILANSNTYWIYLTFGIYFSYLHPSFILYYMGYSEYQLYLLYFGASCTKYRFFFTHSLHWRFALTLTLMLLVFWQAANPNSTLVFWQSVGLMFSGVRYWLLFECFHFDKPLIPTRPWYFDNQLFSCLAG